MRTITLTKIFTVEKRGRMLRRARKFGKPDTYERSFTMSADVSMESGMKVKVDLVWNPVRQIPSPIISAVVGQGAAFICNPKLVYTTQG